MKKVLIFEGQIAQIESVTDSESVPFLVPPEFFWVDAPADVSMETHEFDGVAVVLKPTLQPTVRTLHAIKLEAAANIASRRYVLETSGITLNGSRIKTDRVSQAAITAAYISMSNGLLTSIDWKVGDGVFVQLDLAAMAAIAFAVASHVQRCFSAEKLLSEQIFASPTIEDVTALTFTSLVI